MVVFPPCKINLGLNIVSRRDDGYHNIETCFYPVPCCDVLEIIPAGQTAFSFSGNEIQVRKEDNLCWRAYELLKRDHAIPPFQLHLHKIIPLGAGLGGGSSDASTTLLALNQIFSLGLSHDALRSYASQLGSDCPFFINPAPMLGTGKGDVLKPLPLKLDGIFLVIVKPDIHISTAEAYRRVTPAIPQIPLEKILETPVETWRGKLTNDFERSVFQAHPEIEQIKTGLYHLNALYASMSGSGSSVFGLFEKSFDVSKYFSKKQIWSGVLVS